MLTFLCENLYEEKVSEFGSHTISYARLSLQWARIAYLMTASDLGTDMETQSLLAVSEISPAELEEVIEAGKRCGILMVFFREGERVIRFENHRLQEYFAAQHLCRARLELPWLEKLDRPRWQETLFYYIQESGDLRPIQDLSEAIADLLPEYEQVRPPSSFPSELDARLLWGPREDLPPAFITPGDDASASLAGLETRLADLVELASRVIRECAKVVPLDETELVKAVERAAGVLAGSSPVTQVKIIRSCLNNPFLPLIPSLQTPLRSDIAWVRDQALIAVVSDEALARTVGSDTGAELAYDLAGGTVIQPHLALRRGH